MPLPLSSLNFVLFTKIQSVESVEWEIKEAKSSSSHTVIQCEEGGRNTSIFSTFEDFKFYFPEAVKKDFEPSSGHHKSEDPEMIPDQQNYTIYMKMYHPKSMDNTFIKILVHPSSLYIHLISHSAHTHTSKRIARDLYTLLVV